MKPSLHDKRESARVGSTKVRNPQEFAYVYRMTGLESGRDHGYKVGYSIEPETMASLPNGTKVRLSILARFFQGQEVPWSSER
jgi:hypothetical protein